MTSTDRELAKLQFDVDEDVETMWAVPLGDNLYRLDNSPFYAYGVSWLDVVEAIPQDEGFPLFRRVVRKSGHKTVRVIVNGPEELERLKAGIAELGCSFEGAWSKVISVDLPPEVELERVREYLITTGFEWEHADPTYEALFEDDSA